MLLLTAGITETDLQNLYSDEYIQRVGHDHRPASPVHHPLAQYLTCRIDGVFCGAFLAIRLSPIEFELHALLLRSAISHSREFGRMCLAWAFDDPSVMRVSAPVIGSIKSAINYCLRLGFHIEGVRRNACRQNGVMQSVVCMGMLREEWSK